MTAAVADADTAVVDGGTLAAGREALRRLRQSGREAQELEGGTLRIAPKLPPHLREQASGLKPAILTALRAEAAEATEGAAGAGGDDAVRWPPVYTFPVGWRQEYGIEREALRRRLARCDDAEAEAALRGMLAATPPASEAAWLELGAAWLEAQHGLHVRGILPDYDWPAAGR